MHTVCTDHAPWSLAAKLDPTLSITNLRPGVENLQTLLPMLYSEGVRAGRISLQRLVEVTSTNAARLFGLWPRKGNLLPGADADVSLVDLGQERVHDHRTLHTKSRGTALMYDGVRMRGWPVMTLVLVLSNAKCGVADMALSKRTLLPGGRRRTSQR